MTKQKPDNDENPESVTNAFIEITKLLLIILVVCVAVAAILAVIVTAT
ncbi:hypothetical protein RG963_15680 [Methanosarcina sp. Z-7115]|uniref:Uncharacterized protein n=1 Tax=Methanosarcina baikalica TaxID=3073890 RepID=A0ABU2D5D4_9EURY|nr:hypothetical protein [Methanosarcina sp. Z-7115]MDR7667190.1 hypothetical protein [Methanosarcina sp. Z-7115]